MLKDSEFGGCSEGAPGSLTQARAQVCSGERPWWKVFTASSCNCRVTDAIDIDAAPIGFLALMRP